MSPGLKAEVNTPLLGGRNVRFDVRADRMRVRRQTVLTSRRYKRRFRVGSGMERRDTVRNERSHGGKRNVAAEDSLWT